MGPAPRRIPVVPYRVVAIPFPAPPLSRACCDALELTVADASWPVPKYREMLFPV